MTAVVNSADSMEVLQRNVGPVMLNDFVMTTEASDQVLEAEFPEFLEFPEEIVFRPKINCENDICIVTTTDGVDFVGIDMDGVIEFRGIPYALPPTGKNRFRAPIVKHYRDMTVSAMQYSKKCATHQIEADQDEDCLTGRVGKWRIQDTIKIDFRKNENFSQF